MLFDYIDERWIIIRNGNYLKGKKADGSEKLIFKITTGDKIEFSENPEVGGSPLQTLSEVNALVLVEKLRAEGAEGVLQGNINTLEAYVDTQDAAKLVEAKAYTDSKALELQGQISNMMSNVDPEALDSLSEIVTAFQAADQTINGAISSLSSSATSALNAEIERATLAESNLQSELDATQVGAGLGINGGYATPVGSNYLGLASSLKDADSKLDAQIKVVADNLASEILEVEGQISTLQSTVDSNYQDVLNQINNEVDARVTNNLVFHTRLEVLESDPVTKTHVEAADLVLDGKIETEKGRIDAILLASNADKDSFAEIVTLINSVDTENDTAFGAYVLSNNAAIAEIESNLGIEETNRIAGDASTLASAESYTDAEVLGEKNRAELVEAGFETRISGLEQDVLEYHQMRMEVTSGIKTQGYVELGHVVVPKSLVCFVNRFGMFETDDFTMSTVNGKTKLTFTSSFNALLEVGDVFRFNYKY